MFRLAAEREADRLYAVAFTPRSGSTRLADILSRSELVGNPREWFNPALRQRLVVTSASRDLAQYYRYLKTNFRSRRVFGVEVAWAHLRLLQTSGAPALLDDIEHWFFLRRRDLAAQAISLYKAQRSGTYHSIQGHSTATEVDYDARAIAGWVLRLVQQEFGFVNYFDGRDLKVRQLWYEELSQESPADIVRQWCQAIDLHPAIYADIDEDALATEHRKLADARSEAMIEQFRAGHAELLDYWAQHRGRHSVARFLRQHPDYADSWQVGARE
jgi:LPS sulfotransferase NodH